MNKFPSNKRRQTRPDEDQMSKTVLKQKTRAMRKKSEEKIDKPRESVS